MSACATPAKTFQTYPPAADLAVEPKPILSIDALASEKALNDYDVAVEAWGQRGWQAVARICRWADATGAKGLSCPK